MGNQAKDSSQQAGETRMASQRRQPFIHVLIGRNFFFFVCVGSSLLRAGVPWLC